MIKVEWYDVISNIRVAVFRLMEDYAVPPSWKESGLSKVDYLKSAFVRGDL